MKYYLHSYTKALKRYDKDLFADVSKDGIPCVFRKVKRFVPVCVSEDFKFLTLIDDKQYIFAITDNWAATGTPRFWGIDDVVWKVQSIDSWENQRLFEELDEQNDKADERKRRHMRNEMEAFWADNRREFVKATDDILIHSLSKDEPKKRLKDRSIKNGNN